MNRPFTFYPNTLSLGPASSTQSPSMNVEWRLIFKDQFDKFSHSLEMQLQQQLQNYTSSVELMLGQQSLLFQQKLEELQQLFSHQLLQSHTMLLESVNQQISHFQSQRDNLANAVQKIAKVQTTLEKQSADVTNSQNEIMKMVSANVSISAEVDGKFSPSNFIDYKGNFPSGFIYGDSAFVANPAAFSGVTVPEYAALRPMSTRSSVSIPNASTPVSVDSVGTYVTKSRSSTPSINNNNKKKSGKRQASKAVSAQPDKVSTATVPAKATVVSAQSKKVATKKKTKSASSKSVSSQKANKVVTAKPANTKQSGQSASVKSSQQKNTAGTQLAVEIVPTATKSGSSHAEIAKHEVVESKTITPSQNVPPNSTNNDSTTKNSKKKKKKNTTQVVPEVNTEEKGMIVTSELKPNAKDIMIEILNGQTLHVNILYLISQLQLNSFKNVQDMMIYLEKQKEFRVHDCWVECSS